jgi:hypothetical protein
MHYGWRDSNQYSSEQFYGFIYGCLALWAGVFTMRNAMAIILRQI